LPDSCHAHSNERIALAGDTSLVQRTAFNTLAESADGWRGKSASKLTVKRDFNYLLATSAPGKSDVEHVARIDERDNLGLR